MKKVDTGFGPNEELNGENLYSDANLLKDNYTPAKVKRKFEHLSRRNKECIIDLFTNKGLSRSMISSALFIPYSTVWKNIKEGNAIKEEFENIQQYSNSNIILNSKLKQEIENHVISNGHPFIIKDIQSYLSTEYKVEVNRKLISSFIKNRLNLSFKRYSSRPPLKYSLRFKVLRNL